jgi:hypothetical protein
LSLGKGDLPQEQSPQEEPSQKPGKRPIFKMVKVNAKTKQPYGDDDFLSGAPFAMVRKIVGYEPIKEQLQEQKYEPQPQKRQTKIRSWIGMVFFALKIGDPCAIQKAFFEKQEATG